MRKHSFKIIAILFSVLTVAIFVFSLRTTPQESPEDYKTNRPTDSRQTVRKQSTGKSNLRKRMFNYNIAKSLDAANSQADFNDSAEELTRKAIISSKVAPYFIDLAPFAFDKILDNQQVNEKWTQNRNDALDRLLEDDILKTVSVLDMQCYESVCKLEFSSREEDTLAAMEEKLAHDADWFGAAHFFHYPNEDGTFETSAYIGRPHEDEYILDQLKNQIYEDVIGESPDSIEPTQEQIQKVLAYREDLEKGN